MNDFKSYFRPGTCDVCGKQTDVIVCCSAFGAISYAYCEHCFNNRLEPYYAMVDYISCAGLFPEDINEEYQALCRHIIKELGISEEKFIADVDAARSDYMDFCDMREETYYDEENDFC